MKKLFACIFLFLLFNVCRSIPTIPPVSYLVILGEQVNWALEVLSSGRTYYSTLLTSNALSVQHKALLVNTIYEKKSSDKSFIYSIESMDGGRLQLAEQLFEHHVRGKCIVDCFKAATRLVKNVRYTMRVQHPRSYDTHILVEGLRHNLLFVFEYQLKRFRKHEQLQAARDAFEIFAEEIKDWHVEDLERMYQRLKLNSFKISDNEIVEFIDATFNSFGIYHPDSYLDMEEFDESEYSETGSPIIKEVTPVFSLEE
ncbi:hypothetical protein O9G_001015 [Rozella allomycis CSF55]|uniref:Uncharacterized protein n=1 Tax=Rozella allomycis (strain CSF55) TaxID=988480 RepID=A0A075AMY2_ROZAC|nr:hypothetical protein O9G_001015 [Rozella allomycis CSF55]|eukprot:EPZ31104.1 hypothetical protein O9G_001015 [Rozella allomycis CSF55]